jgi:hypothetical protein
VTPHDITRQIQRERRPWWLVWYGTHTRHYWALALWVPDVSALEALTPDELVAQINAFELFHPKPR